MIDNYKIKFNSESESKDFQDLFSSIGFRRYGRSSQKGIDHSYFHRIGTPPLHYDEAKEITEDQLRSMANPKEYLFKGIDGNYKVVDHDCQGRAIEIPEGADIYLDNSCFYKLGDPSKVYLNDQWEDVAEGYYTVSDFVDSGDIVLWQRHTQPEELPFLDDEPKVDETLQERQSQYGEFKEVASTTQYLLQMLSNDKMSDVQLESLHMICSKLARIAHGDPNHIDSWHDIAGYATLVVKDIS